MANLPELLALLIGLTFAIFLSLPIVLTKRLDSRTVALLNAAAIGLLIFLVGDVYSNVAPLLAASSPGTPTNLPLDAVFAVGVAAAFGLLFLVEQRIRGRGERGTLSPRGTALIVALAIGFQNLTEGLVFGSAWASSVVGLETVIYLGFFLQNITEGFPITAPLAGVGGVRSSTAAGLLAVGGVPTVLGGLIGFYENSTALDVLFDAVAIGAILYAILPMLRGAFRPAGDPASTRLRLELAYVGIVLGFTVGFLVNAI
ncbi:MAG TPA: hypothetical protein VGV64_03545 [Thermoplasmata archaeon]|nr:hypothetical protein [Thermoplasmata archaeon]